MASIIWFLSFFVLLFIFFIFVSFRMAFFSSLLIYILILFPNVVPFVALYLEESKLEKEKAKQMSDEK